MACFDQRPEDQKLGDKAGCGRNAGERQQKNQHQDGGAGIAFDEAVEVVNIVADYAFVAQHHHDGERAGVEEGVDE